MNKQIDINCDMGESYGYFRIGNDEAIFPFITSSNIACGYHGGDPLTIQKTILKAIEYNVQIGAHPSYPDLAGFGRRKIAMSLKDLAASLLYQIGAVKSMTESLGGTLAYVKPHGALYHTVSNHQPEAKMFIEIIQTIDSNISVMALAGSQFQKIAQERGIEFIAEAFLDRQYEENGQLVSRSEEGAVITDSNEAVKQFLAIVKNKEVKSRNGSVVPIQAQSICVHGDNQHALELLKAVHAVASENNIQIKAF